MQLQTNTDGAVVISVKCDIKDAGKELERLQKKLKKAEDAYSDKTSRRDAAKAALTASGRSWQKRSARCSGFGTRQRASKAR